MKMKMTMTMLCLALALVGCKTQEATPIPNTTSAVLVGLGYKCDKTELQKKGSDLDVASMYESIRYCYGDGVHYIWDTGYNNIVHKEELLGPFCNIQVLQDEDATLAAVKTAIKAALDSDLAIIYFSCKATQVEATDDKDEEDGLDEAMMLYDGLLVDNDIWEILKTAKNRVFIVFDTSHSASMFKATASNEQSENMLIDLAEEVEKANEDGNLNMVCWSACLDNESIDERSIGSRMTNAFYFKYANKENSYDYVFEKMVKSTSGKQNLNKTIVGTDFSNLSMFR